MQREKREVMRTNVVSETPSQQTCDSLLGDNDLRYYDSLQLFLTTLSCVMKTKIVQYRTNAEEAPHNELDRVWLGDKKCAHDACDV